nr:Toll/interleukin-1 receptor (TIR) domain-containing protein [Tanacetum cinerariifolium]
MPSSSSSSSSLSFKYDVFLSFRRKDTRKTFVDHLYSALDQRLIRTYKDDITLPWGESVGPVLLKSIKESSHAVVIFSKNYAYSSWCLDELVHIMKCRAEKGQIVIPIFYDVEPTEVRKQIREFGKAFAKLIKMNVWRKLFAKQETKNVIKVEMWRKAIVDASNIFGLEPKHVANGHEAAVVQKIADAISDNLLSSNYSNIDEELVGMSDRVKDMISKLEIGTCSVRMVGIWGVGGGGKTTLATSVYMKIKDRFQGHCIIDNIREESSKHSLKTLQEKLLTSVLKTEVEVQSEKEGKCKIQDRLCRSIVLILLDDVDNSKQLEALAGSHKWFGDRRRIIITTRDAHLLQKVDYVSPVRLLSREEGNRLFKKYAYNDKKPLKDYEKLSLRVVSYAGKLSLALKVLGSFLYDKDGKEWISTLDRLKDIPPREILKQLKIGYDGLETMDKELFLDITCFFRGERKDDQMEILDAFGFHPNIGIRVLIQKALITINSYGEFDMHDLENDQVEVIYPYDTYNLYHIDHPELYSNIVPNIKKLRWLIIKLCSSEVPTSLSNELRYIEWDYYPASRFPDSFQPTNLGVLKMKDGLQTELWKSRKSSMHSYDDISQRLKSASTKFAPDVNQL